MAELYQAIDPVLRHKKKYWDKKSASSPQEWNQLLAKSRSVYVGNLAFQTTEEQVYGLFSTIGSIRSIVMGLNSANKTSCGFCFVTYDTRESALAALNVLNQSKLDERIIRVDLDSGIRVDSDNRKLGRSVVGGQWRDVFRAGTDHGRGGEGLGMTFDDVRFIKENDIPASQIEDTGLFGGHRHRWKGSHQGHYGRTRKYDRM